jgi:DNA-binding beta-propeller fold protein YncE
MVNSGRHQNVEEIMATKSLLGLKWSQHTTLASLLVVTLASCGLTAPLTPGEPILLQKTQGRFDFLRIDAARHRLLLAHTGNKSLDVFDLDSRQLLGSIPTGAAQDSAVDAKDGRYFVSVSAPPKMAIVDAVKLELIGEVPLPAAADLLAFNPVNGKVYVCNDTAPELWVIDPEAKKTLTVTVSGGGMEDLSFSTDFKKLFQVVKDANTLLVIDLASNKVLESWSTSPAASPHGMALVPHTDFMLVAGGNGKLVLMSRSNGKVVADADIAPRVDEMTYDPQLRTAYCASGQGKISTVSLKGEKLTPLGDVESTQGCHSIIVDPKTHLVWIAYAKGEQSFVQPFMPAGRLMPTK